jgi:alpha-beta hydrolase superfamily lysophospholipase
MKMVIENYEIYSGGSIQLFCTSWQADAPAKAVLFIVHGLGEHQGRYEEMAQKFVNDQIAVFAFDHRGHGQSEGKRGHCLSINQFVEDVEHALMKCRSLFLELPIFLFGHSMGGQIIASYLNKVKSKEISGAIISSPWIELVNPPPKWQISLAKRLSSIVPSLTVPSGLDPKAISSVAKEVTKYQQDPLVHSRISLSLFHSLYLSGTYLLQFAEAVKLPVLVCHGESDKITSMKSSEQYAAKLGTNASFKLWEGAYHEPHHDFDKESVMDYYVGWILKHIKK